MPEEEEYNVDRLLSKRVRGGVTQYEVRWTGFDETTWEPAENLNGTLVQDFEVAENLNGTLVQDFEAANRKRSIDLLSPDGKYRGSTCNTTAPLQLGQHVIVPFKGKDCNGAVASIADSFNVNVLFDDGKEWSVDLHNHDVLIGDRSKLRKYRAGSIAMHMLVVSDCEPLICEIEDEETGDEDTGDKETGDETGDETSYSSYRGCATGDGNELQQLHGMFLEDKSSTVTVENKRVYSLYMEAIRGAFRKGERRLAYTGMCIYISRTLLHTLPGVYAASTTYARIPAIMYVHVHISCTLPYPAGSIRGVYYIQYHVGAVYPPPYPAGSVRGVYYIHTHESPCNHVCSCAYIYPVPSHTLPGVYAASTTYSTM